MLPYWISREIWLGRRGSADMPLTRLIVRGSETRMHAETERDCLWDQYRIIGHTKCSIERDEYRVSAGKHARSRRLLPSIHTGTTQARAQIIGIVVPRTRTEASPRFCLSHGPQILPNVRLLSRIPLTIEIIRLTCLPQNSQRIDDNLPLREIVVAYNLPFD